jgi:hypothetical protein
MSRPGWLAAAIASGLAILALSFVDAWIVHRRELTGEGYRVAISTASGWRSVGLPVLAIGVAMAVLTAGLAVAALRGWLRAATWLLPVGAILALGLVGATLVPIAQDGHTSRIDLAPGWAAFAGTALALAMVVAALRTARPTGRHAIGLAGLAVVTIGAGAGGRWAALEAGSAPTEAWALGSYTRAATGDQPELTLTVEPGRYRIGERWSGAWESHSWTVILLEDPACPDARGTYHAHNVGADGADLRFVRVVDTCADGGRSSDLETGIWERDP